MAITFLEKRRFQRNLLIIFSTVVLITFIVYWRGFLVRGTPKPAIILPPVRKIEINYEALKNPLLDTLQVMEEPKPFEGQMGRENPFLPY